MTAPAIPYLLKAVRKGILKGLLKGIVTLSVIFVSWTVVERSLLKAMLRLNVPISE